MIITLAVSLQAFASDIDKKATRPPPPKSNEKLITIAAGTAPLELSAILRWDIKKTSNQRLEDGFSVISSVSEALKDVFDTASEGIKISTETEQVNLKQSDGVTQINSSVEKLTKVIEKSREMTISQNKLAEELLLTSKDLDSVSIDLSSMIFGDEYSVNKKT